MPANDNGRPSTRHRRTARQRREQRQRAVGRAVQVVTTSVAPLNQHRGGRASTKGNALLAAFKARPVILSDTATTTDELAMVGPTLRETIVLFGLPVVGALDALAAPSVESSLALAADSSTVDLYDLRSDAPRFPAPIRLGLISRRQLLEWLRFGVYDAPRARLPAWVAHTVLVRRRRLRGCLAVT